MLVTHYIHYYLLRKKIGHLLYNYCCLRSFYNTTDYIEKVRSYIAMDQTFFFRGSSRKVRLSGALISIRPMLCNAPHNPTFQEPTIKKTFWSLVI